MSKNRISPPKKTFDIVLWQNYTTLVLNCLHFQHGINDLHFNDEIKKLSHTSENPCFPFIFCVFSPKMQKN